MKIIYPLLFVLSLAIAYIFFLQSPLSEKSDIEKKITATREYINTAPGVIQEEEISQVTKNNNIKITRFSPGPPTKARFDGELLDVLKSINELEEVGILTTKMSGRGPYRLSLAREE